MKGELCAGGAGQSSLRRQDTLRLLHTSNTREPLERVVGGASVQDLLPER